MPRYKYKKSYKKQPWYISVSFLLFAVCLVVAIVIFQSFWGKHEISANSLQAFGSRFMCRISPSETGAEHIQIVPDTFNRNGSAYLYDREPPRGIIKSEQSTSYENTESDEATFGLTMYNGTNYTFTVNVEPSAALYYKTSSENASYELKHEAAPSYTAEYTADATYESAVVLIKTGNGQRIKRVTLNVTTTREDWDIDPARAIHSATLYRRFTWNVSDLKFEGDELFIVGVPEDARFTYLFSCYYFKSFVSFCLSHQRLTSRCLTFDRQTGKQPASLLHRSSSSWQLPYSHSV